MVILRTFLHLYKYSKYISENDFKNSYEKILLTKCENTFLIIPVQNKNNKKINSTSENNFQRIVQGEKWIVY